MLWAGVVVMALAVRLAAAFWWQARLPDEQAFAFPDSDSYWTLGERIAHRETYEFAGALAFRAPGYPVALAPLFVAFGDRPPVLAARVGGALLGVAAVIGIGYIAWKLFDQRTGLLAALFCALYPGAVAMSILVLSEALFCPLMVGQMLLWRCAWKAGSARTMWTLASAAGAVAALATLTRPSWLLLTPLAILLGIAAWPPRSRQVKIGAAMLAAMLLTMLPWWIRNAYVLGAFVPTTTQVGASLYDGLHPGATGASDMSFAPRVSETFRESKENTRSETATLETSSAWEVELNRHFADEAIAWARHNPSAASKLAAIKFARTWNIWPNEASLRSTPMRLLVAVGFVPILIAALCGAWRFARRGWPYVLCLLPAAYFTMLHMVFVGSIRYRQPPMLLLIVLAAGWVATLKARRPGKD